MMLHVIKNESFNSEQALHRKRDDISGEPVYKRGPNQLTTPTDYIWSVSRPGYVDIYRGATAAFATYDSANASSPSLVDKTHVLLSFEPPGARRTGIRLLPSW